MMKKFINLLSFEMNRFLKFLIPTLLITAAAQLFVTISSSLKYNNQLEKMIAQGEQLENIPNFSLHDITANGIYEMSLMLIVLVFVFYSFFTWYREWLGKNTFIYRLLMLPTNRTYLLLTKSLVFLIGGLLAFVFQFGLYFIQLKIAEWLVTDGQYIVLNIHNVQPMYSINQNLLFPTSIFEFVSRYSFAFAALISLFAGIIIERSFGLKGLIIGAAYFIGFFVLYSLLSSLLYSTSLSLRPSQMFMMKVLYQFIMIGIGTLISSLLLKNKIKV